MNHRSPSRRPWPPPAFDVLVKPTGARCNLACRYCYYRPLLHRVPGASLRMSEEVLERFVEQYMGAQRVPEVSFGWQGGEPLLMGLPFFQRAVDLQRRFAPPSLRVYNYLQTNGTLLDGEWSAFLKEHDFLVGISLDGPPGLHNALRVDAAGQGSSDAVLRGLEALQRRDMEFNILTCLHSANVEHPLRVYRYLRDQIGARFIQFIPVVEPRGDLDRQGPPVTDESVDPQAYGRFLISVFQEWVRRDVGRVFVQLFDVMLAAWVGAPPGLCAFGRTCGEALVLEHDGDLYSCDHFVTPEHRLGNILQTPLLDLVGLERQRRFGLDKETTLPSTCRECAFLFACRGDCPKHRLKGRHHGEAARSHLCEGYRAFLTHAAPYLAFMAREIAHRRSPAGIMAALSGRNGSEGGSPGPSALSPGRDR